MIPVDWMVMILTVVLFPLVMMIAIRQRVANKMLCIFLVKDKSLRPKLLPIEGDFVKYDGEAYNVDGDFIRMVRYPLGWPKLFQQVVPSALYMLGTHEQKDWVTVTGKGVSAREVGVTLQPYWMEQMVSGTRGKPLQTRWEKMAPMLAVVIGGLCLLIMLVLYAKIGAIERATAALQALG